MPFLFSSLKYNAGGSVGSGVHVNTVVYVSIKTIKELTNHTLHHLELFAQFSGEFLLAVVKLYILRGCFPQPTDEVRQP